MKCYASYNSLIIFNSDVISKIVFLELQVGDDSRLGERHKTDGPAEQVKRKVMSVHLCCKSNIFSLLIIYYCDAFRKDIFFSHQSS